MDDPVSADEALKLARELSELRRDMTSGDVLREEAAKTVFAHRAGDFIRVVRSYVALLAADEAVSFAKVKPDD